MISITLNFKSIETARQALLEIPQSALAGAEAAQAKEEASPKPPKATPAATPVAAASGKPTAEAAVAAAPAKTVAEPAPTAASAEAKPQASTAAIEYPVLQKAVFALAGKSREAAAAVAASLGVKTFKELPADKWSEALGAVTEKLAELESA